MKPEDIKSMMPPIVMGVLLALLIGLNGAMSAWLISLQRSVPPAGFADRVHERFLELREIQRFFREELYRIRQESMKQIVNGSEEEIDDKKP